MALILRRKITLFRIKPLLALGKAAETSLHWVQGSTSELIHESQRAHSQPGRESMEVSREEGREAGPPVQRFAFPSLKSRDYWVTLINTGMLGTHDNLIQCMVLHWIREQKK